MAKGQQRGNREVRKPKKEKSAVKVEPAFGAQIKQAGSSNPAGGKPKK